MIHRIFHHLQSKWFLLLTLIAILLTLTQRSINDSFSHSKTPRIIIYYHITSLFISIFTAMLADTFGRKYPLIITLILITTFSFFKFTL